MLKVLVSVILFINLLRPYSQAQQVYFNNRYNIELYDGGYSILPVDSGFVAVDVSSDLIRIKTSLVFLEAGGSYLSNKGYGSSYADYYGGTWGSLKKTFDGGYVLAGSYADSTVNGDVLLYKFNASGDTIWTKRFGDSAHVQGALNVAQTKDSGYIITALTTTFDPNGDRWLIKVDSMGNIQWQKHYGSSLFDAGTCIIQANDGGYLMTGEWAAWAAMDLGALFALKTDSAGNQQWFKSFGAAHENGGWNAVQTKDGGYVICGGFTDSLDAIGQRYGRHWLVKLDSAGNLDWEKKYGAIQNSFTLFSVRELPDGSIIACGITDSSGWGPRGSVLKTNSQGDSIWFNQYVNLNGLQSVNRLYDLYPTDDGGIVCTGFVAPLPPDTGTQDLWVLKLDSMGCEIANCVTGIGPIIELPGEEGITAFPNPFTDWLTVKGYGRQTTGDATGIEIRNALGEIVFQTLLQDGAGTFNLSFLDAGIYFVVLKAKEKYFNRKIFKI